MENASKAIIIVGGVAIGLVLLAVMVYVFNQGARVTAAYDQKQITNQLEFYNSRFEKFNKDNNTIIDAISLANLAYNINNSCNYDLTIAVEVEIVVGGDTFTIPNTNSISERNTILNDDNLKISIYNLTDMTLEKLKVVAGSIGGGADKNDKLSTTKLKDGKTVYKYLFKVEDTDDIEYHPDNGKVSKVRLTAYVNPEW